MELWEKQCGHEEIFLGRVVHLVRDTVELPDGHRSIREVVRHPGAVAVAAVTKDRRLLLVTQYRYPFARTLTEIPAGKLDPGEEPDHAAARELREETGATADLLRPLGSFFATPAIFDENIHLYYATGLHFGESSLDPDEFLTCSQMDLDEAVRRAACGDFPDGKTQAAIMRIHYLIGQGELPVL